MFLEFNDSECLYYLTRNHKYDAFLLATRHVLRIAV